VSARAQKFQFLSGDVALAVMPGFSSLARRRGDETAAEVEHDRRLVFDWQLAVHEAGHGVASRVCGLPVAGITILFENGHHGAVWADDDHRNDAPGETSDPVAALHGLMPKAFDSRDAVAIDLLRVADQIVGLVAGREAELQLIGRTLERTEHDIEQARCLATLLCRSPRSVDAYIEFARCEARALLCDHRTAVIALADALLLHRTLDDAEIKVS
jgi:hypothetical protein